MMKIKQRIDLYKSYENRNAVITRYRARSVNSKSFIFGSEFIIS